MAGMRWEWAYVIVLPCGGDGRASGPRDQRPPGAKLQRVHGRAAILLPDRDAVETPPPPPAQALPRGPWATRARTPRTRRPQGRDGRPSWKNSANGGIQGHPMRTPYWLAIGLPHGVARERFIAEQRRHCVDERLFADTTILVGLISGATLSLKAALRGTIRRLRLQVA